MLPEVGEVDARLREFYSVYGVQLCTCTRKDRTIECKAACKLSRTRDGPLARNTMVIGQINQFRLEMSPVPAAKNFMKSQTVQQERVEATSSIRVSCDATELLFTHQSMISSLLQPNNAINHSLFILSFASQSPTPYTTLPIADPPICNLHDHNPILYIRSMQQGVSKERSSIRG